MGEVVHMTASGLPFIAETIRYVVPITEAHIAALRKYDRIVLGGSLNLKLAQGSEVWQQVQYAKWDNVRGGTIYINLDQQHDTPEQRDIIAKIISDHLDLCMKVKSE